MNMPLRRPRHAALDVQTRFRRLVPLPRIIHVAEKFRVADVDFVRVDAQDGRVVEFVELQDLEIVLPGQEDVVVDFVEVGEGGEFRAWDVAQWVHQEAVQSSDEEVEGQAEGEDGEGVVGGFCWEGEGHGWWCSFLFFFVLDMLSLSGCFGGGK